jgi:hypothetical protein
MGGRKEGTWIRGVVEEVYLWEVAILLEWESGERQRKGLGLALFFGRHGCFPIR